MRIFPSRPGHSSPPCPAFEQGFTYIGLLILLAVIGLISTAIVRVGTIMQRRDAEADLLAIGGEFRSAFISYANATPPGKNRYPASLRDLLKDPRYPNIRRHLRKLYVDPITGKAQWGTVSAPDGSGIIGVYSLSTAEPIKIGNFAPAFQDFEGKRSYRDWKFMGVAP